MSRRSKTQIGVFGILTAGFVLGYIAACMNVKPEKPVTAQQPSVRPTVGADTVAARQPGTDDRAERYGRERLLLLSRY